MVNDSTTGQAFMAILEAQDLAAGPIAKIHLKHHYPQGVCVSRTGGDLMLACAFQTVVPDVPTRW